MPYKNYHSARLKDPNNYTSFAYKKDELGSGIDVVYGIKNGKSEIQAIRFNSSKHSYSDVSKWIKKHNYSPIKIEKSSISEDTVSGDIQKVVPAIGLQKRIKPFKEFIQNDSSYLYRVFIYNGNYKDFDDFEKAYDYYLKMEKQGDDPKKPVKIKK